MLQALRFHRCILYAPERLLVSPFLFAPTPLTLLQLTPWALTLTFATPSVISTRLHHPPRCRRFHIYFHLSPSQALQEWLPNLPRIYFLRLGIQVHHKVPSSFYLCIHVFTFQRLIIPMVPHHTSSCTPPWSQLLFLISQPLSLCPDLTKAQRHGFDNNNADSTTSTGFNHMTSTLECHNNDSWLTRVRPQNTGFDNVRQTKRPHCHFRLNALPLPAIAC